MSSSDAATRTAPSAGPEPAPVVDVEQAEAALVEHYPRLVRLGYLVLPPSLGRNRRVLTAHWLTQRTLPRGRTTVERAMVPAQRGAGRPGCDPGYGYVRLRVLRSALEAGVPLRRRAWPRRAQLPPLLPQVWGLRLFPRSGGADELALDQQLSALGGPARAAYVLRGLERLPDAEVRRILEGAGVADPHAALAEADGVAASYELLGSSEFDPCSLQARPPDLMRRRQHGRAALAAAAAALVCGTLLALPGDGLAPGGPAAPAHARNPAAEAALDPGKLTRAADGEWRSSARTDFSVWPARGSRTDDRELLGRALAVWARPGPSVQVSATPGTASGAPPGPAQLLYAGEVGRARVVVLYDGLRLVRYAEPRSGAGGGAALDFARVDGAGQAGSGAVVVSRGKGAVRYLTAPWVRTVAVRDLRDPGSPARELERAPDGVTGPLPAVAPSASRGASGCAEVAALELREEGGGTRLVTDLGELTPARLTSGRPQAPHEVEGEAARAAWARTACLLGAVRSNGVRSVNSWAYATQRLPEGNGTATWVCTRADTWRGAGSRVLAQFQAPGEETGAIAARAQDSPACGARDPRVLAGVLWKSRAGHWHVLAAGSKDVASIRVTGGAQGAARGHTLAAPARKGAQAQLTGRLANGKKVPALR
ncbi:hypothetical protein QIS99_13705 [Streptomyces sp. B-S-A8]|uniref:DNA-directed RNA polymerase specialized sigma24 family protein n=1 Tax=Streptomyces solicavernae TaxID=3043614 RepID=A0ABT6RSR1_9ACTN|nr:hypothetical protein [Streptomyces sp. B-S-A8]MDI3387249.1 hypothetical protein [Streptomyces sp. B-S-A8]